MSAGQIKLPQFGSRVLGFGRGSIRADEDQQQFGSRGGFGRTHQNDGGRGGGRSGGFGGRNFENEGNEKERGFLKGLDTDRSSNKGFGKGFSSKFDDDDEDASGSRNSGFGGGRGSGFGGSRGRGGANQGGKPGDWICPDENCGNSNFAFRQNCQKCDTAKPDNGGRDGGFGRMKSGNDEGLRSGGFGKGGRDESQKGEWICPDGDCGNKNFSFRKVCQKCNTPKPEDSDGCASSDKFISFIHQGLK